MRIKKLKSLLVAAVLSSLSITGFGAIQTQDFVWAPKTRYVKSPNTQLLIGLQLTYIDNEIAKYKVDGVVPDPDGKLCENSEELCILFNELGGGRTNDW